MSSTQVTSVLGGPLRWVNLSGMGIFKWFQVALLCEMASDMVKGF